MKQLNTTLYPTTAISANTNTGKVNADYIRHASFQVITTGTLNGSFQVQVSNDPITPGLTPDKFTPTNWSNFGSSVAAASAGVYATGTLDVCFRWMRVAWTNTSGSGNLTVNMMLMEG